MHVLILISISDLPQEFTELILIRISRRSLQNLYLFGSPVGVTEFFLIQNLYL